MHCKKVRTLFLCTRILKELKEKSRIKWRGEVIFGLAFLKGLC